MIKVVCYGEVLWDFFSDGKQIGGAPFNVARQLANFNFDSKLISAIGNDDLGIELMDKLKSINFSTEGIQKKTNIDTGSVTVKIDASGSAAYNIKKPVAWDAIELNSANRTMVAQSAIFIYGSLASRSETSRSSLLELLKLASFKVFDANLRPPHYHLETLDALMQEANLIKLNEDELQIVSSALKNQSLTIEEQVSHVHEIHNPKYVAVTLGEKGALLFCDGKFHRSTGYSITVKDTVGAGDAFLAALVSKLIASEKPKDALNFACAVGALVASKAGANPSISEEMITNLMQTR